MLKIAASRILELKTGWAILNKRDPAANLVETTGEYLDEAINLLASMLPQGSVVVELGGTFGIVSTAFSQIVGAHGKVYALAAGPANFRNLCANLAMNQVRNVKVLEILQTPDHRNVEFFGNQHLLEKIGRVPADFDLARLGEAHCQLVFSTLPASQTLPVIQQSLSFITRTKPIVAFRADGDESTAAVQALLTQAGYQLFVQEVSLARSENYFAENLARVETMTMHIALDQAALDSAPG